MRIGRIIRQTRTREHLSQVELAKKCHISQVYLSDLETGGRQNPSLKVLQRISRELKITISI